MSVPAFFMPEGDNATGFNQDDRGLMMDDTICGLAQKNARMWQIIALFSLSCFIISLVFLGIAANMRKEIPVIVTVNPEGQANYVGRVSRDQYNATAIPEIAKEYQIRQLLAKMHTRVIDRDAQQKYIAETMAIVQSGAKSQLDLFYRANNPYTKFGEQTKSASLEPLLKQTDHTYICYFTTTERSINGYVIAAVRWNALVTINQYAPTPQNPLGIYVTNFDIKKVEEKK
jgi:type IV secretory pathway TrbF-like protein